MTGNAATSKVHQVLEGVGRRRSNPIVKAAVRGARALVRGYDGPRGVALADMARNGEAAVLERLRGHLDVVFDVGANVGGWSQHALDAGAKQIHAFEISPATQDTVVTRYENEPRVTVNRFGLSNEPGTVTIHHYPDHPALTTMTEFPHDVPSTAVDVPVQTGDSYVKEHNIDRIDFMKLDVEGAEELVIAGFADTFKRNAVSVVQFEYGKVSILTKYLLKDFYEDLANHGFEIGIIGPTTVQFMPYDLSLEKFNDSNWLAVHKSRSDLMSLCASS